MARKKYKRRADGRFDTTVKIGVNPKTGRPIRKHIYARTVKELEAKRAEFVKQRDMGLISDKPVTFAEYAEQWMELTKSGKSTNTKNIYSGVLRKHSGHLNPKRLDKITKSDVQLQLNQAAGHHATQEHMIMTFKQIFDCAVDDGLILRNPASNIKLDVERKEKQKRALTDFELNCVAAADLDPEERCFISLLLYTGMRKGEVFALSKSSVDLKNSTIHVNRNIVYGKGFSELDVPKSNAGFRDIPILEPLKPILSDYMQSMDSEYFFVKKQAENGEYEFLTKAQTDTLWKHIYKKLNETAKQQIAAGKCRCDIIPPLSDPMQGITPHYFRHNFATILYYADVDVKEAARILGHSNANITMSIYTHLDREKSASADKIDRYLKEG